MISKERISTVQRNTEVETDKKSLFVRNQENGRNERVGG